MQPGVSSMRETTMSEARFGRLQKAATLVPLAVLSAAWTASLVGVGLAGSSATSADARRHAAGRQHGARRSHRGSRQPVRLGTRWPPA